MAKHTLEERDAGYFLPEDSQLLLKQLSGHIRFLARLAQPRIPDETKEWAPVVEMADLMFCFDQLAEQLELVLKGVSWREWQSPAQETSETPQAAVDDAAAELEAEAEAQAEVVETASESPAYGKRLVFVVTLEQIDKLNRLISGIKAYGDAVSADGMADFAPGTLSMLGHTIFDQAIEVNEILDDISAQQLEEDVPSIYSVEETPPAYLVRTPFEAALPAFGYPTETLWIGAACPHLH